MGCMVSRLAAKFAFFPPSPATYQVKKGDDGRLVAVSSSMPIPLADDSSLDVLLIDTKRGNKIVAFYLKNPYARLTLLYSHGNAADLGQLYDLFVQLKVNLRVNLMGYDYSGYGASTGKPSEYNTYADIEAVYECLETEYGVSQENLILYGQSVGSGPTLHLAAQLPRLRGVVLHSAILSGLRVLCHVKFTLCFDIYKNVNKIQKVKCPVLVIHGTEDDVVNWVHGNGLWKMAREPYEPLWIKGGGHCNLEIYPDYIRHLSRFIQEMENITTAIRLKKIRQSLGLHQGSDSNIAISTRRCCRIKLPRRKLSACWRPSCPECCWPPKCPKSCWRPKCPKSCWRPKCPKRFWRPKCPKLCWLPKCPKCCWPPKCPKLCWLPKCPKCCWRPKCLNCCWRPKCLNCCWRPKCLNCCWRPKCQNCCWLPKCPKCCWQPKCVECWRPKCTKCLWRPKCSECWRPSCIRCFSWRCFVGTCCVSSEKQNGES